MAPAPPRPAVKPQKVRYFKGKPVGAVASDSDSDEEEDVVIPKRTVPKIDESLVAGGAGRIIKEGKPIIKMELGSVKVGGDGGVKHEDSDEEESEEESDEEAPKPKFVPKLPGGDESSEYETDSEEESEEEVKPAIRPVFVSKNTRKTVSLEQQAKEAEEKAKHEEEERIRRKLDSKDLAGETIRRELAEKEVGNELIPDVDDTDGLDPEAEFEEWRARELTRLVRDKQAEAERDAEREEIERRRAMPEDQRMAEDMAYADATRAREKGEMGFLQKYYHKGAFHQDDELLNRDYTAATESQVDMQMLPKVMQVRDFGKASRTKYTHLTDQDTSSGGWGTAHQNFGRPGAAKGVEFGCWNCELNRAQRYLLSHADMSPPTRTASCWASERPGRGGRTAAAAALVDATGTEGEGPAGLPGRRTRAGAGATRPVARATAAGIAMTAAGGTVTTGGAMTTGLATTAETATSGPASVTAGVIGMAGVTTATDTAAGTTATDTAVATTASAEIEGTDSAAGVPGGAATRGVTASVTVSAASGMATGGVTATTGGIATSGATGIGDRAGVVWGGVGRCGGQRQWQYASSSAHGM
ncbi:hypothetical protein VHUM_01583 [Vanrija humicola]|uniref:Micro-fibrillar-associated protein 1 C-terminal domain-containing protein n=1 Tax=Vanrija humicola TaxID=5417 RepID=A0A7D8V2M0_VANHU|nr:hypothetical protein VHUM_01583 [Vanrija humicola]